MRKFDYVRIEGVRFRRFECFHKISQVNIKFIEYSGVLLFAIKNHFYFR